MTTSPLAGKPAPAELLVDLARLERAYYETRPDLDDPSQRVAFGTSGHRGSSLAGSFNEAHIVAVTQAICEYRAAQGTDGPLYLGKDTHALSGPAERSALEVLAANGVTAVIQPGGLVAELVPADQELRAEAKILPKDVGHVKLGQKVKIKVSTYDFARYGFIWGELTRISASSFLNEKGEPHFKGQVTLSKNYVGEDSAQHVISPGMTITAERAEKVNFTAPYWEVKNVFVAKKGSTLKPEEVYGQELTVGMQAGTSEAKWMADEKAKQGWKFNIKLYDSAPMAIEDLVNGRIDLAAMNYPPARDAETKKPVQIIGVFGKVEEFGAAVRKEDKDLLDKLNKGLEMLKADPYWEELIAKHLNK